MIFTHVGGFPRWYGESFLLTDDSLEIELARLREDSLTVPLDDERRRR